MEAQTQGQIVDEIRELCGQYQNEVPSRRRTWPRSIKERVLQLLQLELSCEEINAQTGIPAPTIYSWKSRSKPEVAFLPIQVVPEKAPIAQKAVEPRRRERKKPPTTIIVIAPNGTRFEGLDLKSALAVAREMGSWS
jgi:hypothetical protein